MSPVFERLRDKAIVFARAADCENCNRYIIYRDKYNELIVLEVINTAGHIEGIREILKHFGIENEQPTI